MKSNCATSQNQQRHAQKYATLFYLYAWRPPPKTFLTFHNTHKLAARCGNKLHLHYAMLSTLTNESKEKMFCVQRTCTSALPFRNKMQHTFQRLCKILAARRAQWEKKKQQRKQQLYIQNYFIKFNYTKS